MIPIIKNTQPPSPSEIDQVLTSKPSRETRLPSIVVMGDSKCAGDDDTLTFLVRILFRGNTQVPGSGADICLSLDATQKLIEALTYIHREQTLKRNHDNNPGKSHAHE